MSKSLGKRCVVSEVSLSMLGNLLQKSFALSVWERHCFKMVRITIVLILAILSMEILASPLNLEVSFKGVQKGNTAEQSTGACTQKGASKFLVNHITVTYQNLLPKSFVLVKNVYSG